MRLEATRRLAIENYALAHESSELSRVKPTHSIGNALFTPFTKLDFSYHARLFLLLLFTNLNPKFKIFHRLNFKILSATSSVTNFLCLVNFIS